MTFTLSSRRVSTVPLYLIAKDRFLMQTQYAYACNGLFEVKESGQEGLASLAHVLRTYDILNRTPGAAKNFVLWTHELPASLEKKSWRTLNTDESVFLYQQSGRTVPRLAA